jgi:hypothetical protein
VGRILTLPGLQAGWSAAFTPLQHPKAAELRFDYGKSVIEAA